MFDRDTHRHPLDMFDFSKLFANLKEASRRRLKIFRIFVAAYADSSTLGSRKRFSPTFIYWSFGNSSPADLQSVDSLHCAGIVPEGASASSCFSVWEPEFQMLHDGFFTILDGELIFVCGGLGIVRADMQEGIASFPLVYRSAVARKSLYILGMFSSKARGLPTSWCQLSGPPLTRARV
jgi:hypothetical protein